MWRSQVNTFYKNTALVYLLANSFICRLFVLSFSKLCHLSFFVYHLSKLCYLTFLCFIFLANCLVFSKVDLLAHARAQKGKNLVC